MSHEISIQNGKAEMFSGNGKLPWHGLGQVVSGLLTASEAIQAAGLQWAVNAQPVSVNGQVLSLTEYQAVCRADTGGCLGIMKGRYEMIQNSEAFNFFDAIVGQGRATYETAGALRCGKQVWILAKYNGEIKISDDMHRMWCLLVTSHDGSQALSCQWVTERVVCANTLSIALRGKKNCIKIRHTANWANKEEEAKRVLGLTEDYFTVLQRELATLQNHSMSADEMNDFARLLYPAKDEKEVPTRTSNMRWGTARLFDRGAGNHGATRWDALNAVTDWADHNSTLRGENSTRLESSTSGSAAELKQRAFDLLSAEDFTAQLIASRPHVVTSSATTMNTGTSDFDRLVKG